MDKNPELLAAARLAHKLFADGVLVYCENDSKKTWLETRPEWATLDPQTKARIELHRPQLIKLLQGRVRPVHVGRPYMIYVALHAPEWIWPTAIPQDWGRCVSCGNFSGWVGPNGPQHPTCFGDPIREPVAVPPEEDTSYEV